MVNLIFCRFATIKKKDKSIRESRKRDSSKRVLQARNQNTRESAGPEKAWLQATVQKPRAVPDFPSPPEHKTCCHAGRRGKHGM
jgi:hypothetical protein